MGIVHHANYLVWFELARTRLCLEAGFHYAEIEKRACLLLVTGAQLTYRAPARYGERGDLHLLGRAASAAAPSPSPTGSRAARRCSPPGRPSTSGSTRATRRPARFPDELVRRAAFVPSASRRPRRGAGTPPLAVSSRPCARLRLTTAGREPRPRPDRHPRRPARRAPGRLRAAGARPRPPAARPRPRAADADRAATARRSAAACAPARRSARPLALWIENRDWPNWQRAMAAAPRRSTPRSPSCAGCARRGPATPTSPAARSTCAATCATCSSAPRRARATARVAAGAFAKMLLAELGVEIAQRRARARTDRRRRARRPTWDDRRRGRRRARRCARSTATLEPEMVALVDEAKAEGRDARRRGDRDRPRRAGRARLARLLGRASSTAGSRRR